MRPVATLSALERTAHKKLDVLRRRVARLFQGLDGNSRALSHHLTETGLSYTAINLQTFWSNWCRAHYLSCALGTVSVGGSAITSNFGFTSSSDAMAKAIHIVRGGKSPPHTWHSYQEP